MGNREIIRKHQVLQEGHESKYSPSNHFSFSPSGVLKDRKRLNMNLHSPSHTEETGDQSRTIPRRFTWVQTQECCSDLLRWAVVPHGQRRRRPMRSCVHKRNSWFLSVDFTWSDADSTRAPASVQPDFRAHISGLGGVFPSFSSSFGCPELGVGRWDILLFFFPLSPSQITRWVKGQTSSAAAGTGY